MGDGVDRRDLSGAEGAAGFRDHQGEETIHAAPKAPENISAGNFHDLIHAFLKASLAVRSTLQSMGSRVPSSNLCDSNNVNGSVLQKVTFMICKMRPVSFYGVSYYLLRT